MPASKPDVQLRNRAPIDALPVKVGPGRALVDSNGMVLANFHARRSYESGEVHETRTKGDPVIRPDMADANTRAAAVMLNTWQDLFMANEDILCRLGAVVKVSNITEIIDAGDAALLKETIAAAQALHDRIYAAAKKVEWTAT